MASATTKKQFQFDWTPTKEAIKKADEKKDYSDERFWKLTHDEKGESMAIIRFIPTLDGTPYISFYQHSFKYQDGGEKWYVGNCVSTFGYDRNCPICAKNSEYWKSEWDKDKAIASERKRKLFYIANILVVKNPLKPEEEGKTFLFRFGQKIYDKIKAKITPSANDLADPDFVQFIPFDLYEGANFKLKGTNLNTKVNKKGTFPNYDTSEFSPQSALLGGDDKKITAIMNQTISLAEFVDETKYPKNDEVSKKLACILGGDIATEEDADMPVFDAGEDDIPDFAVPDETPSSAEDNDADWFEKEIAGK